MTPSRVITRQFTSFAADTTGIAAVEFALGSIVFLGIMVGVMEVGRGLYTQDTIEHAAKEGARYAAIHNDSATDPKTDIEIEAYVKSKAPTLDQAYLNASVTWPDGCRVAGCRVRVSATFTFNAVSQIVPWGNISMTAASSYTATR